MTTQIAIKKSLNSKCVAQIEEGWMWTARNAVIDRNGPSQSIVHNRVIQIEFIKTCFYRYDEIWILDYSYRC